MLVVRPIALFVFLYLIFAAVDLFVLTQDLVNQTYSAVLEADMYLLVLPAACVVVFIEWLMRRKAGKGQS